MIRSKALILLLPAALFFPRGVNAAIPDAQSLEAAWEQAPRPLLRRTFKVEPKIVNSVSVNLSAEWSDVSRSQYVGDCHAYASAAVAEAAYFRQNDPERVHINEDDLFLHGTVLNPSSDGIFNNYCRSGNCKLHEGQWVGVDIRYLFNNGAALVLDEDGDLHVQFTRHWGQYRDAVLRDLDLLEENIKKGPPLGPLKGCKKREGLCAQWRDEEGPQLKDMKDDIAKQAGGKNVAVMRADLKDKIKGYRLFEKKIRTDLDFFHVATLPERTCRDSAVGKDIAQALKAAIGAGYPVAASMNIGGIKEWGSDNPRALSMHAFVIKGYKYNGDEPDSFQTRNSWGPAVLEKIDRPDNPDLRPDQLCRVLQMHIVLGPNETLPKELADPKTGFQLIATAPGR